jgi:uncharacterized membrane protein YccF (DUF307 family)
MTEPFDPAQPVPTTTGAGSVVLNVLWVLLAGFWLCLAYLVAGVIQCLTIIGIPFGIQSFKLAGFALWPFGRVVVTRPNRSVGLSVAGNVLWFILAGLWLALAHALAGVVLCITVIGIPLGIANFKLIPLAISPFGKDIVKKGQVAHPGAGAFAF